MSLNIQKIILIFILINSSCQSHIVISLKGNNPYELYNNISNKKLFTENFLISSINNNYYTLMGIGKPDQNIVVRIIQAQKDFLFNEKNCKVFYDDIYINKNKLGRNNVTMKYNKTEIGYRKKLSQSFSKNYDINIEHNYGKNFFCGKERMKLDDYRNILNKDKFDENEKIYPYSQSNLINFSFVYEDIHSDNEICGSIGLASYNDKNNNKFVEQLKSSNITQNYYWSIKYLSYDIGYIIFGILPHQYLTHKTTTSYDNTLNLLETYCDFSLGRNLWAIQLDEIYFNSNKEKIYIQDQLIGIFSFSKQIIIGTSSYKNLIITNFFQEYFDKNICALEKYLKIPYSIIKCQKNEFENKMNQFPDIYFNNKELQTVFNLTYQDLFITFDKEIYFLIIFRNTFEKIDDVWELGVPFLKKYQIIFNSDTKKIGYYININRDIIDTNSTINKDNKTNSNFSLRTFLEIIVCIIFILLLILLIKKLYLNKIKQKRPFELQDEDYDYFSNTNTKLKKNDDINYSNEDKTITTQIIEMEKH